MSNMSGVQKETAIEQISNGQSPNFPNGVQFENLAKLYKNCCQFNPTKRPLSVDLPAKLSTIADVK